MAPLQIGNHVRVEAVELYNAARDDYDICAWKVIEGDWRTKLFKTERLAFAYALWVSEWYER